MVFQCVAVCCSGCRLKSQLAAKLTIWNSSTSTSNSLGRLLRNFSKCTISSPSTVSPLRWNFSKVSSLPNWLHRTALRRLLRNSYSKCTTFSPSTASPPRWNFSKVRLLPNRRYQIALGRLLRNSYSKCFMICTTMISSPCRICRGRDESCRFIPAQNSARCYRGLYKIAVPPLSAWYYNTTDFGKSFQMRVEYVGAVTSHVACLPRSVCCLRIRVEEYVWDR